MKLGNNFMHVLSNIIPNNFLSLSHHHLITHSYILTELKLAIILNNIKINIHNYARHS